MSVARTDIASFPGSLFSHTGRSATRFFVPRAFPRQKIETGYDARTDTAYISSAATYTHACALRSVANPFIRKEYHTLLY